MTTPRILLISCYELGHQPLELAGPLGALRQAGLEAAACDLAVQPFDARAARAASLVGIATPMQTALRLGVQAARRARAANPRAHICFFGLYAWLNREYLLAHGADSIIGGETEAAFVRLAQAVLAGESADGLPGLTTRRSESRPNLERPALSLPDRAPLAPLSAYTRYVSDAEPQLVGYVEATKGCQHLCRHCPIVPVYQGRLLVVPVETVLGDVRQQVAAGAQHVVFGDADFLNGPTHSLRIARAVHAEFPELTFDFTAKVEHVLEYPQLFPEFAALGCTFMTTAVESLSDSVLDRLGKGHTGANVAEAIDILDQAGIAVQATLVAFTPWTTLADYLAVVDFIQARGLQENFRPVQMSVRLLVPPHSALAEAPDAGQWLGPLDAANFSYVWQHPDPRMDALYASVSDLVASAEAAAAASAEARSASAVETHARIRALAYAAAGRVPPVVSPSSRPAGRSVPRLSEDWFCCAEPTRVQVDLIQL